MRNEYLETQIRDAVEKYKKKEKDLQVTDIMGNYISLYPHSRMRVNILYSTATGTYRGD